MTNSSSFTTLREATRSTLDLKGTAALGDTRLFVSTMLDLADHNLPAVRVFAYHVDDELLAPLVAASDKSTPEAMREAQKELERILVAERHLDPTPCADASEELAGGLADHLGIPVATDPATPPASPVSPVATSTPVQTPGTQKRSMVPVLLGLVAVLAIALVGVFVFMGSLSHTEESLEPANAPVTETTTEPEPEPEPDTEPDPKPDPSSYDPAFPRTSDSSHLPPDTGTGYYTNSSYEAWTTTDGDHFTAWNEGAEGYGEGEWIRFEADEPQWVNGIMIIGGFSKDNGVFSRNTRPHLVSVSLSDGSSQTLELRDAYREEQYFAFDEAHETTYVQITIESVYAGSKYQDCCIDEVRITYD